LKEEVHRLKIERDIYEKAAEIIKKEQGINIQQLTNREKAIIINALRDTYLLKELLEIISMAKSSYCYQSIALNKDKYADLRIMVKNVFSDSSKRYGYRRIHSVIKNSKKPKIFLMLKVLMLSMNFQYYHLGIELFGLILYMSY
jgi:hypothetical protein